jgi:UDP-2,3-diacylglucosamine hydrolase
MIYFASDFHLGSPNLADSKIREGLICRWLDSISSEATDIYLLGDVFDFWFEYKKVVPKGNIRFLGKLAELTDRGIRIHLCVGNHDLWIRDYFKEEINIRIFTKPEILTINKRKIFLHHGDGLGPGDYGYKFIKKIFTNSLCQTLFSWIHPDIGIRIAEKLSRSSRKNTNPKEKSYLGDDKEYLTLYSEEILKREFIDYFIFGHRHLQLDILLSNKKSRYINLGNWYKSPRFACFDGEKIDIREVNFY